MQESIECLQAAQTSLDAASSFLLKILAKASTTSRSTSVQCVESFSNRSWFSGRHARLRSLRAAVSVAIFDQPSHRLL